MGLSIHPYYPTANVPYNHDWVHGYMYEELG
jgi:hypothetical protein